MGFEWYFGEIKSQPGVIFGISVDEVVNLAAVPPVANGEKYLF